MRLATPKFYNETGINIYVSTTGNDSGDGTQTNPLLTLQKALDYASRFDSPVNITINVAEGTYTPVSTVYIPGNLVGIVKIVGSGDSPEDVIIDGGSVTGNTGIFNLPYGLAANVVFDLVTFQNFYYGHSRRAIWMNNSNLEIGYCIFKNGARCIEASNSSNVVIGNGYTGEATFDNVQYGIMIDTFSTYIQNDNLVFTNISDGAITLDTYASATLNGTTNIGLQDTCYVGMWLRGNCSVYINSKDFNVTKPTHDTTGDTYGIQIYDNSTALFAYPSNMTFTNVRYGIYCEGSSIIGLGNYDFSACDIPVLGRGNSYIGFYIGTPLPEVTWEIDDVFQDENGYGNSFDIYYDRQFVNTQEVQTSGATVTTIFSSPEVPINSVIEAHLRVVGKNSTNTKSVTFDKICSFCRNSGDIYILGNTEYDVYSENSEAPSTNVNFSVDTDAQKVLVQAQGVSGELWNWDYRIYLYKNK